MLEFTMWNLMQKPLKRSMSSSLNLFYVQSYSIYIKLCQFVMLTCHSDRRKVK